MATDDETEDDGRSTTDDGATGGSVPDAPAALAEAGGGALGWIRARTRALRAYVRKKPDPLTSIVFVLPVFLAYSLGALAIDRRVGVDFVSRMVLDQLLERSVLAYVLVHLGVAGALGGVVWLLRKKGKLEASRFLPMLGESVLWALVAGALVHLALASLLPAAPVVVTDAARAAAPAAQEPGTFARCVLAVGAGFYEEVVFRAAVVGTIAWALPRYASLSSAVTGVVAIATSTVLFVVYRWLVGTDAEHTLRGVLDGVVLGALLGTAFRFRGFAVAVYAHSLFGLLSLLFGAR